MHQPYYRSAFSGAFEMPWARMHALKDYADMVNTLAAYPTLHQTFNLVPSLVEQLEIYASGDFVDVYWDHTLKPAADLDATERAFVVERMCERPTHPRPRTFSRYLELAQKREACLAHGWADRAAMFTVDELRDLQVWFNMAWFDPLTLESEPLASLVQKGRDFTEEDKLVLAQVQAAILTQTLPAYRDAAARGQVELTTSPYYHPILPLLANTDSARIAAPDTLLPPTRFAHPEDAREHIRRALDKHAGVFGSRPAGMWCSEQAVGEDVVLFLIEAGIRWTISDETVLARSLSGAASLDFAASPHRRAVAAAATPLSAASLYRSYRLPREGGEVAMVFRDHTLSDLIGFAYQSWDSREAANDLLRRLHEIRDNRELRNRFSAAGEVPLVTIALDGENAWEYYPRDGRDFLKYLYEGLASDDSLRCVTVAEHLAMSPPHKTLGWLHTGSWIGGDLRTWSGDRGHTVAWEMLHRARDLAAARRGAAGSGTDSSATCATETEVSCRPTRSEGRDFASRQPSRTTGCATGADGAWSHILVAEGSDWFWWFGDHHRTELDYVWDLNFRLHLQAVYRALGEPPPLELFFPILGGPQPTRPCEPAGTVTPVVDGVLTGPEEWQSVSFLEPALPSTMQPAAATRIRDVGYGWMGSSLCLLLVPAQGADLLGLEVEMRVTRAGAPDDPVLVLELEEGGDVAISCLEGTSLAGTAQAAWKEVLEVNVPLTSAQVACAPDCGLVVRVGRRGMTEHVFHTTGIGPA
jgi:alpha-amylase/alpha-mannosidase (GH57 family)